jgi:hypothetical protein
LYTSLREDEETPNSVNVEKRIWDVETSDFPTFAETSLSNTETFSYDRKGFSAALLRVSWLRKTVVIEIVGNPKTWHLRRLRVVP